PGEEALADHQADRGRCDSARSLPRPADQETRGSPDRRPSPGGPDHHVRGLGQVPENPPEGVVAVFPQLAEDGRAGATDSRPGQGLVDVGDPPAVLLDPPPIGFLDRPGPRRARPGTGTVVDVNRRLGLAPGTRGLEACHGVLAYPRIPR